MVKWELDLWYEMWERAGSQGLDTWYDLRGRMEGDEEPNPVSGPDVDDLDGMAGVPPAGGGDEGERV